ncbi:ribonuclease E [Nocardioides terrae]|uniref:Ribonuclease E n=1 Tax=Nocardioides terrae TaxID=574651 RepID=A0A1I1IR62_9ACTN|nr:Rne/Rng family ribonuclease [Nocardioides terrae]SFC38777.1 ribonuclease E [Nocardioides terrae]
MADEPTIDNTQNAAEAAGDNPDAAARPAKKAAARKTAAKKAAPAKKATATKRTAAKKAPAKTASAEAGETGASAPESGETAPAKRTTARRTAKKAAAPAADEALPLDAVTPASSETTEGSETAEPAKKTAAKRTAKKAATRSTPRKTAAKKAAAPAEEPAGEPEAPAAGAGAEAEAPAAPGVLFQAPQAARTPRKRAARKKAPAAEPVEPVEEPADEELVEEDLEVPATDEAAEAAVADVELDEDQDQDQDQDSDESEDGTPSRRRRRRGGRRRRKSGGNEDGAESTDSDDEDSDTADEADETDESSAEGGSSRRRRRRRRTSDEGDNGDNPPNTVTRVRESKPLEQQITAVSGSTRLEAKKQRRREGREAGRRRAPIVSEAEFLARRESVERVMVIRQREDLIQIGVLEDKVLVEHYVARESQTSLIGNIYLGRVQNVLPSMEAAFIDIGKGRNAVLYAGEVNWAALGHKEGQQRKIESVLSSGQTVLVQVTKDPIGHKGARLTSQISLAGRFLVYVPDGTTSGISRKLPDTERNRLKSLLREIVPDTAGVIVRTAAEGASEDELTRDVERLKARWEDIEAKSKGSAPQLLYGEPDLTLKVVRDLFTEDFAKLVVQGDEAWDTVKSYVDHVAPDLSDRVEKYDPAGGKDLFATYRVEEQIAKGLDRKVWLPSGGSLIIDRTEAMTVVDVNTGKFTGSGGNLEETVTKNNLEAAEEIVRQLRLRDIGGIIVVDFIDMVLESNRDLVLRRLVECLGRDRTRHQVAEVTSLGLVQMTRKRIGTGLVEAFSETCTHCQGRGVVIHDHPVESGGSGVVAPEESGGRRGRRRGGRGRTNDEEAAETPKSAVPSPKDIAQMPRHEAEDIAGEPTEAIDGTDEDQDEDQDVAPAIQAPIGTDVQVTPPPAAPEPETPKVVTRTRSRRGASRPVVSTGAGTIVEAAAPEPVAAPVAAPVAVAEAPEPPKVVTRTRRGASRTVVHTGADAVPDSEATPSGEAAEAHGEEEHIDHVPVKRKGARKR